jgi:mRNA deadenylase 3'-5' endonuclease subunit Ccr4
MFAMIYGMQPVFTFCTWNILANAYLRREYYPNTPAEVLSILWRVPALGRRAEELNADILCLQEVEDETFAPLMGRLAALGYAGSLVKKARRKPDGCATFFRTARCRLMSERRLIYADGDTGPSSGHVAQVMEFAMADRRVQVVNTHLKWDPPGTPRDRLLGLRQASLALDGLEYAENSVQIICGDFNVTAESPILELMAKAGFQHTHPARDGVYTCNSSRVAKLIDYIFYRGPVRAEPLPLRAIDGKTPLPSEEEPSDHLPLGAEFTVVS